MMVWEGFDLGWGLDLVGRVAIFVVGLAWRAGLGFGAFLRVGLWVLVG